MSDPRVCRSPGANPEWWFSRPGSAEHSLAKKACIQCPLYWECRDLALKEGIPEGIYGGMDGNDRRKIWRTWPEGRPRIFDQVIDANTRPLLQQRRDHENFDANAEGWRFKINRQTARQRAKRCGLLDEDNQPIDLQKLMESA